MESLGLQTVTLSDGTMAYVQQAVKGIAQGPQHPTLSPSKGLTTTLPSCHNLLCMSISRGD